MVQSVVMEGGWQRVFDLPSVFITGGGTICAVLVAFTLEEIKTVPQYSARLCSTGALD